MGDQQLYIVLISIHGLIRGENLELGRDADTGGQTKYVVELAKALSRHPNIGRVDLLTRLIQDPKVSEDYAQPEEQIAEDAWIIRIPCGPKRYIRKEALWPSLDTFTDLSIHYFRKVGKIPDIIHGHYADAGYVGANLSSLLEVPMIFTGHSLGRDKRRRLLSKGMSEQDIQQRYNIQTRIDAEEYALSVASSIIASTKQEIEVQYERYEQYQPKRMSIVPPGIETDRFRSIPHESTHTVSDKIKRFLIKSGKPMILAIARADERKNLTALVMAYAQSEKLKEMANLVIVAGTRDDIATMNVGAKKVLTQILVLVDKYDLYGHMAYPKDVAPAEVPTLYALAAKSKGVFVNPALTEPFGLTLIEAATVGLPLVATNDGGPRDIIGNCKNGILIDPLEAETITKALEKILGDKALWKKYSKNGKINVDKHYAWESHAQKYMKISQRLYKRQNKHTFELKPVRKLPMINRMMITDIDNTLLGDPNSLQQLVKIIDSKGMKIGFGVATGRHLESAVKVLKEWGVPTPDFYITSVGTEIHYGKTLKKEEGWSRHISYRWEREKILALFSNFPGMRLQPRVNQREFKISFIVDAKKALKKREIQKMLRESGLAANIIFSHGQYLDLIPIRASKGHGVRYLALKWGLELGDILVAGDSGNDESMLKGETCGVVVGNYSPELGKLKGKVNVYFADTDYAGGIVEGLQYFSFLEDL